MRSTRKKTLWRFGSVIVPLLIMLGGVPYFGRVPKLGPFPGLAGWYIVWIVLVPACVIVVDHFLPYDDGEDA